MAIQDISTLKGYFNTGDTPSETQFADLIDTLFARELKSGFTALTSVAGIQVPAGKKQLYYTHDITVAGTQALSFDATATYEQAWVSAHFVISNSLATDETITFPSGYEVKSGMDASDGNYATGTLTIAAGKTIEMNILNTGAKKIVKIDGTGDTVV